MIEAKLLKLENFFYLPYFIPAFYIVGNAPLDVAVSIIAIISFYFFCIRSDYFKENINIFFYFSLFFISFLISSLLTNYNLNESLVRSFLIIRFFFFTIAIGYFFSKFNRLEIIVKIILFVLIFYYLALIYQLFFDYNLFHIHINSNQRLMTPFNDELIAGTQIFILTNIFIFYNKFFNPNFINKKLLLIIIFCLSAFFILRSGERMAFFKFLFCMSLFLIIYSKSILKSLIFIFLSVFLIIGTISINKNFYDRFVIQFSEKFTGSDNEDNYSLSNFIKSGHGLLFKSAFITFKKNYIFGVGSKQFRNDCFNNQFDPIPTISKNKNFYNSCSSHPHNYVLEILSENGIIGFVLFMIFIIYIFNNKNISFLSKFFFSVPFLIFLWPISSTGSFFSNSNSIFWFCIGLYLIKDKYFISRT